MENIKFNRYIIGIVGLWTIIVGFALFIVINEKYEQVKKNQMVIAQIAYKKDLMYRRWIAIQGGVYVNISEHTPPNPYLQFIDNRDVVTTNGDSLTLVNPAYMTRQVLELSEREYGLPGHLTSLKPINPQNKPDELETKALLTFEKGDTIFTKADIINGEEYFRLIQPFVTEKKCLKCHQHQGYKEGEIRGALSISVPTSELRTIMFENISLTILSYLTVWFIGVIGFLFISYKLKKQFVARKKAELELIKAKEKAEENFERFKGAFDASAVGMTIVSLEGDFTLSNKSLLDILGYGEEELHSKTFQDITHPDDLQKDLKLMESTIRGEISHYQIEKRYFHKTGSIVWAILNVSLVRDSNNQPIHFVSQIQDITERKKNEEQLALLSSVIEQSPAYIFITDTKGVIEYANPAFTEITGYAVEDAIGKNPRFLKSGKVEPEVYAELWTNIKKGNVWRGQFINKRKNGEEYHEQVIIAPVKNQAGEIIRYFSIKEDITVAKRNELALKKAQKIAKLGNWELDIVKNQLYWSDEIYRMFDLKPQEFKATYEAFLDHIHPDDRDAVNEAYTNSLKTKQPYIITHRLKLPSGEIKYVSEQCNTEFDKNGNPLKSIGIVQDVTNQKQIENALIAAKQEAERANRLKSEFLANMSHEIRTPMNAVLGFSEILSNKLSESTEYKPLIEGIVKGGRNLISLINDILDLSKIEAGYLEITSKPVNLLKLIEDIKQIFAVKIKNKNLQFPLEIDSRLPSSLMLDQTRIRQILFNLVGNALKFTDAGYVSISVKIEGDTQPESSIDLYFEVKDTGMGIPKNQIGKIFEAFRQIEGQSGAYGGTGLGLPITKKLVEAMNGNITVDSVVGKGSTFHIHLKKVDVPSIEISSKSEIEQLVPTNIQFNKPTILLVDDVESNRDVVKYHLATYNCEVVTAENGKEAINYLKKHRPNLILMDIQMPVMDGYRATKLIKKQTQLASIPVIALTALAMKEQVEKYGDVFNDYLKKPIAMNELIQCLMAFLPYTKTEAEQKESKKTETTTYAEQFAADIVKNGELPEAFIKIYKTEILPMYEEVSDIMDMEDCKQFATKLIEIGTKFNIETFVKFGTELITATENYQVSKIEQLLTEFSLIMNGEL